MRTWQLPALHDPRFWMLAAALLLVLAALLLPRVTLIRPAYDVLAVIDITDSMNVRDMTADGKPESRLEAVKQRLRAMLANLPCQSRFGLGIFSERRVFILFEPMEICENFASIDRSIFELDWRMAWEGDSYITRGVYDGIANAAALNADLMFFTDGQEAPPLPYSGAPAFDGKPGAVKGLIVGVGGSALSPIPKFDDQGREIGVYSQSDVLQESRFGMPPPGAESRPGYHPRNAPFGDMPAGNEHLSSLKVEHLRDLAKITGLAYTTMGTPDELLTALEASARAREVKVATDISAYPAALALAPLVLLYAGAPLYRSLGEFGASLRLPRLQRDSTPISKEAIA